jgi:DNA-binding NtrC family response regulator
VPPLRERTDDIPLLVAHFIRRYNHEFGKRIDGLTAEALEALRAYRWPGNVRELQNVVERSVVLVDGPTIGVDDLPLELSLGATASTETDGLTLNEASDRFERQIVLRTLDRVDGNMSEAARVLGLHRNSLKAKLDRWKIRPRELGGGA